MALVSTLPVVDSTFLPREGQLSKPLQSKTLTYLLTYLLSLLRILHDRRSALASMVRSTCSHRLALKPNLTLTLTLTPTLTLIHGHDTLHIPRVNSTTYGLHSSAYLGAKVWNCLPQTIKGAVTLSTFKALIQSWYGETCKCAFCRVY